jgi:hypothetical protein
MEINSVEELSEGTTAVRDLPSSFSAMKKATFGKFQLS